MKRVLLDRDGFRGAVLKRDNYYCVVCREHPAQSAHHIMDRKLFKDGGYYIDNGASVCDSCHMLCEMTIVSPDTVRRMAEIKQPVLPEGFDSVHVYDKWGNMVIWQGGYRVILPGPMFNEDGVQKMLKRAKLI